MERALRLLQRQPSRPFNQRIPSISPFGLSRPLHASLAPLGSARSRSQNARSEGTPVGPGPFAASRPRRRAGTLNVAYHAFTRSAILANAFCRLGPLLIISPFQSPPVLTSTLHLALRSSSVLNQTSSSTSAVQPISLSLPIYARFRGSLKHRDLDRSVAILLPPLILNLDKPTQLITTLLDDLCLLVRLFFQPLSITATGACPR